MLLQKTKLIKFTFTEAVKVFLNGSLHYLLILMLTEICFCFC